MNKWRKLLSDPTPLQSENPLPLKPSYNNEKRVLDRWQPKWIREKYFDGRNDSNHGNPRGKKSSLKFKNIKLQMKDLRETLFNSVTGPFQVITWKLKSSIAYLPISTKMD